MGGKEFTVGGGWDVEVFPTDEDGIDGPDTKPRPPLIVDGRGFSQTEVFREAIMFRVSRMSEEKNSTHLRHQILVVLIGIRGLRACLAKMINDNGRYVN